MKSVAVMSIMTGSALWAGAAFSMPASGIAPLRGPGLIETARIVCEPFGRCFRVDPYGRRIFVPRPFGFGRPGYGPGDPEFDGPGLGRPGFGRPEFRRPGFDDRDGGHGQGNGRGRPQDQDGMQPRQGGQRKPQGGDQGQPRQQGGAQQGQGQGNQNGQGQPRRQRQPGGQQQPPQDQNQ